LLPLQAVVGLFLLFRLVMHVFGAPLGDETYYWYWGQHPDLSYFDHPPLHAWLLGVVSIFGWWPISIRILTWLTLGGTFWLFWLFARRLAPEAPEERFWMTAAIYLASPLFFAMTLVSYHDHLLIFLCLAAAWCFLTFADGYERGAPDWRWLYGGAVVLGLAVLTKYNGVLFGLGVGLFFLCRRQLRPLLKSPHLWLAALLAIAMQIPVFIWNLSHGFSSYEFHLSTRWGGSHEPNWTAPLTFLVITAVSIGPFLIWPLLKLIGRPTLDFEARAKTLAIAVLGISTLSLALISVFLGAFFYWNIVAYIAVIPLLAPHIGRGSQLWLHLTLGLLLAAVIVFNFAIAPVSPLLGGRDGGSAVNFGWDVVPARVEARLAEHPGARLAGTRYSIATQLGFALKRPDVVALSVERDQFDYWSSAGAVAEQDFIILADDNDTPEETVWLAEKFERVTELETIPIARFGVPVFNFRILLAEGFRP
ncbi:MAG: phospholipid carrier-dependent glycosyltransferase, partial [Hyphomicrobiales bacterium]